MWLSNHVHILQTAEISQWGRNSAIQLIGEHHSDNINCHLRYDQVSYNCTSFRKFPNDDGILPVKWFNWSTLCHGVSDILTTKRIQILQIRHVSQWWRNATSQLIELQRSVIGLVSRMWSILAHNCSSLLRFPSDDGIVPVNWFENKSLLRSHQLYDYD